MNEINQDQGQLRLALTPPVVQKIWGYEEEFIKTMKEAGIDFRDRIIADGVIYRFPTEHKGRKDGYYAFQGMFGIFGDWSRDIHEKWSKWDPNVSPLQKAQYQQQAQKLQKTIDEEGLQKHEAALEIALTKWNGASETGLSPYLERKKVGAYGVRFGGQHLIIPLRDVKGKLWSFQWIEPDGKKKFLKDGKKKGCFHTIGVLEDSKSIYIVEGYATGASVHMATLASVVVAFDAGSLDPVIEEIRKAYPNSPLIIAGDDDCWKDHNIGRQKAQEAALKYGCSFVFPKFKNVPIESKPTDFNDLHILEGIDAVRAQLQQVKPAFVWGEPKLLQDIREELLPVHALAPELIPEPFQEWLLDIAERMQCPLDYVTIGAMIMTAAVVGAGCGIRPKRQDSWTVIPNLWGGIVGAPSTLKSPALKEILKPLEALEDEAWEVYEKSTKHYQVELEAYKTKKEVIKKELFKAAQASDTFGEEAAKEKLRNLKEPLEPSCKRYITNDATIEKMHELFSRNPRGLLLFRDELLGLLTSWDREGYESDRAFYLEAWNGYGSKTTDRIGRGTIRSKNVCLSLLGSTQPSKLLAYFQKALNGTENDGLLQRFQLLVYPNDIKKWKLVDRKPHSQAQQQVTHIITTLATMDFTKQGALLDSPEGIPYFHFSPEAQDTFYEWLNDLEDKLRTPDDESMMIEHLAKYRKLMPALALLFHLIHVANGEASGPVDLISMERAAGWCDYLESHARRIYAMKTNSAYQAARTLAQKIQAGEVQGPFYLREIYRNAWTHLKNREEAEQACYLLIQNGWLQEQKMIHRNKTHVSHYLINPQITQRAPHE